MVSNSCSQTWHTLAWMFCLVPWAGPAIFIFLKRRRFFFNQLDAGSQLTMLLFIFLFIYLFIYIFIVFCSWHAKYVYVYVKKTKQCRGNLNPYSPASIQWLGPPCQLHLQHEKQNHHVYMANNWKKKRVTAGEVDTWGKELGKCTHQWTTNNEKNTNEHFRHLLSLSHKRRKTGNNKKKKRSREEDRRELCFQCHMRQPQNKLPNLAIIPIKWSTIISCTFACVLFTSVDTFIQLFLSSVIHYSTS